MIAERMTQMKSKTPLQGVKWGYILLIVIALLQEQFVFLDIYLTQTYTALDLLFNAAILVALIVGLLLPIGVSVVGIFVFFVIYLVWIATYAPAEALVISTILLIPANVLVAALIKTYLIRSIRLMERLEELEQKNPQIDPHTTLGNKEAFTDAIVKQSNLARRHPDRYGFCIAMFKIDFLPLVQESLGSEGYSSLLLELSDTIQKQLRYEDYKFFIDNGRFVIICPMTPSEFLESLTNRIKQAMMEVPFTDLKSGPLKLVVRSGALVFQPEQFGKYEHIDGVISALERNTETDLIGEYI
ncbi:diguanylate cyclase [Paenibacillus sp. P96]|uniref:Diguanylate cyclase n=1 Tax=Paenibacillus zeirhizosphaerae TaxID=2987519 RepID=A0ABT9FYA3_9BACL|nr:diguanylate cyclase [Paenibacillus sp. P96]MDP4099447.1 diguanylate cyclase [Paenibacillus sp. P96]